MSTGATPAKICGRFAPTPSGRMHLGNVFALLMAWLAARSKGGSILLRIEDLDPRGQKPELARALIDDIAWLGLDWDGEPIYQSERMELYLEALEKLRAIADVYPCFCTRHELHAASAPHASDGTTIYPGTCSNLSAEAVTQKSKDRSPSWRIRVPNEDDPAGVIEFEDAIYGAQREVLARDTGDFLLARSDSVIAYQLACAFDDGSMGITQVVRGRDLLSSTARQIWLQQLLGISAPNYAHVPLLVAPDGRRLSKRECDLDLAALREAGTPPQAILGWLAWKAGFIESFESLSASELLSCFSWDVLRENRTDIFVDANPFGGV